MLDVGRIHEPYLDCIYTSSVCISWLPPIWQKLLQRRVGTATKRKAPT